MRRYIFLRIVQAVFVAIAVSIIVFILVRLSGDPVDVILPINATPEDRARLTALWGLDDPLLSQYWTFVKNAVRGDFGDSIKFPGKTALGVIGERTMASLELALGALLLAGVVALPLGVISAVKKDTPLDFLGKTFAILGQSVPPFWTGIVLVWIFAVTLDWLPVAGRGGFSHFVLPVVTLAWFQMAPLMRLVRSSMLDALESEYVKLARIKGVPEWKVVWKHCLRNAAIVPLTYFGLVAGFLVTGTVVVETVFAWPGIGLLAFDAITGRDFHVVQAVVILTAIAFLTINLTVDILYGYVDPRIRYVDR